MFLFSMLPAGVRKKIKAGIEPFLNAEKKNNYLWRNRTIQHRGTSVDIGVMHQIFESRDYDLSKFKRNDEILEFYDTCNNPLIIDAGANIGASAVWFSSTYPRAKIVAVEPESQNFSYLQRNTNGLRVFPVHGALAANPGRLQLYDPGEGSWGFRTGTSRAIDEPLVEEVRAFSISELMEEGMTPFILKIDIEGAESDIFDTNAFYFNQFPLVIIELHDWMLPRSGSSRSFLKWHCSQDRDFVHAGENIFSFSNDKLPIKNVCKTQRAEL